MANVTLFVPDQLKKRMDAHVHIRWSRVMRSIIEQKLDDFEDVDRLAQNSQLTEKDVRELSAKVDEAMGKHAKRLLDETRRRR